MKSLIKNLLLLLSNPATQWIIVAIFISCQIDVVSDMIVEVYQMRWDLSSFVIGLLAMFSIISMQTIISLIAISAYNSSLKDS